MSNSKPFATLALFSALISFSAKAQDDMGRYTLWNGDYEKSICEITVGYVNKSWICTYPSGTQREDFFGDADAKFLHGLQVGALFTPSFDWGLGLRTGVFVETYFSRSKWIKEYCSHFAENDLYIPLHASFRIPFDETSALNFYGGAGFQWAMNGKYYKQVGTAWSWWRRPVPIFSGEDHQYGNGWPQKVNWQLECGLNFRYESFNIGFTYSFGIVDHGIQTTFDGGQTYVTANKSRQDKMQATFAFTF